MAKFIGELAGVNTKTNKRGVTETTIAFRVDNNHYGKIPQGIYDCQGLPCLVEIVQQEAEGDEPEGEPEA